MNIYIMIVCRIELFFIIYWFKKDLEVRLTNENDKDLFKALKYWNDKYADLTDTEYSKYTKREELERKR